MLRRLFAFFLLAIFLPIQGINAETVISPAYLNSLTELLQTHPSLKGAIAGVSIRSAETGELLFSFNGDTRLTPASNLKLFTAAAALTTLGKDYTFQTELLTDGTINESDLNGSLYLKGKGDPTLLPSDLEEFARLLKKEGITKINGDLIADDFYFDHVRYSVDVPWSDEAANYGAAISALSIAPDTDYDAGTVKLEIAANKRINEKAIIKITPESDPIHIVNRTKTVPAEATHHVTIERMHGANTIIVSGTIPVDSPIQKEWIAVWEPTIVTLNVFKQILEREGIRIEGTLKVEKTPEKSLTLHHHKSMSLKDVLIPFMKLSNNGHGEILIKEMGKEFLDNGSWEAGLEIEKQALSTLGINSNNLVIRDGSGISHQNLIPANEITNLLYKVKQMEWFPVFYQSLPISGVEGKLKGGTLRHRMQEGKLKEKVIAKTGTLTNVSSLSGYLIIDNNKAIIFSIVLNHLKDHDDGKKVEEDILNLLVNMK